MNFISDKFNPN